MKLNLFTASATVAAIGTLLGAALTVDTRYVHAAAAEKSAAQIQGQITQIRADDLEDKLFAIESKAKKSAEDTAMIEQYKRRLNSLQPR